MIRSVRGPGYEIVVVEGEVPIDPVNDNVDVVVKFEGGRHHAAVFTTLESIRERLAHFKQSGECASGLYFWTRDLIIVERLTMDSIRRTVEDLLENGSFELAFSEPSYDINPVPDPAE